MVLAAGAEIRPPPYPFLDLLEYDHVQKLPQDDLAEHPPAQGLFTDQYHGTGRRHGLLHFDHHVRDRGTEL